MCNAAAFENYDNHYFVHPVSEVLNLTKNFQQGAAQIVSEEGRGVMNLYLCAVCNPALCLACGTTGVTQNHFYGQVQFFVLWCAVYTWLISGRKTKRCQDLSVGGVRPKTVG